MNPPRRPRRQRHLAAIVIPLALAALTGIGGCGDGGSSPVAGIAMPRPEAPEAIDPVARSVIRSKADSLAASPDSSALWMGYGDACLMNLWPEEAVIAYRHALESNTSLDPILAAKVRWRLARALHDTGDAEAADAEAASAIAVIPKFADGWVTLAGWRLDRGDLDGADAAMNKAEKAQPIRRAIVSVQLDVQQGRLDDARATVDALLARGIEDRTINRLAVVVGRAQNDPLLVAAHEANAAESLVVMDDSIIGELAPLSRHERADLLRCLTIRESMPPREALEQIARFVQQRPRLPMLRVIAADLMRRLGAFEQAREVLQVVYEDDPPDHEYWAMDAAVHLELAKTGTPELLDRARLSADRAIEINPRIAYGWQILALIHEQQGEWTKAAEAYRRAAERAERVEDGDRWRGEAMRCDAEAVQP